MTANFDVIAMIQWLEQHKDSLNSLPLQNSQRQPEPSWDTDMPQQQPGESWAMPIEVDEMNKSSASGYGPDPPRPNSRHTSTLAPSPDSFDHDAVSVASYTAHIEPNQGRFAIHQLDPDMVAYLAESGALHTELVDTPWFECFIHSNTSRPLRKSLDELLTTYQTECAVISISPQVYCMLAEYNLLRADLLPKNNPFLVSVMRARLDASDHGYSEESLRLCTYGLAMPKKNFAELRQRGVIPHLVEW